MCSGKILKTTLCIFMFVEAFLSEDSKRQSCNYSLSLHTARGKFSSVYGTALKGEVLEASKLIVFK